MKTLLVLLYTFYSPYSLAEVYDIPLSSKILRLETTQIKDEFIKSELNALAMKTSFKFKTDVLDTELNDQAEIFLEELATRTVGFGGRVKWVPTYPLMRKAAKSGTDSGG